MREIGILWIGKIRGKGGDPQKGVPPSGRAARPFAAVVPWRKVGDGGLWAGMRGILGMREIGILGIGKIRGKGGGPQKGVPPSGRAARPFAAVVPVGKHCNHLVGRRDPSPPSVPGRKHCNHLVGRRDPSPPSVPGGKVGDGGLRAGMRGILEIGKIKGTGGDPQKGVPPSCRAAGEAGQGCQFH
jgi:hypothetical protein